MPDSSVYFNLCSRVIEKRNERVLLSYGWKQFDVFTEIESVEISLRSKTSTSAETVLRNSDSDQHLLEALTIKNTSPRFSREQALWRTINKHTIGHVRYINIPTWLRGFRVKIVNFLSFFCLSIPKRDLDTKKTTPNIEV